MTTADLSPTFTGWLSSYGFHGCDSVFDHVISRSSLYPGNLVYMFGPSLE